MKAQAENLGREECKVLVVKRGGEAELVEEVAQLVNIVIGVQPPELGPHCQHLLLGPGPSGGSRNIFATIIKVFDKKNVFFYYLTIDDKMKSPQQIHILTRYASL